MEYVLAYSVSPLSYVLNGGLTSGCDVPLLNGGNRLITIIIPKESLIVKIADATYQPGNYDKVVLNSPFSVAGGVAKSDLNIQAQSKWSQETINDEIKDGTQFLIKTTKFSIRFQRKEKSIKTPSNLITMDECGVGTNEEGYSSMVSIFGRSVFDHPKPVSLIKYLININPNKNSVVLDFFAGSGTTGQAVLELNKEDGGNRRFILCTNNESNICTDVTYQRLKTVITGIRQDGSKYSEGIPSNLYYFKTDFVEDLNNSDQAKYNLAEKVDSLLCIAEDIFDEKERNDYSSHYVSSDKKKHLFIYNDYFNEEKFAEFKERVIRADGEKVVYVFSFDNSLDESLFEDKSINVKPIPEKIYEIYKEIALSIKRGE